MHDQPSSPESEDSNKENMMGEALMGRSHRRNRSLDKLNHQMKVMPDRPEQMKKKSDDGENLGSVLWTPPFTNGHFYFISGDPIK